MRLVKTVVFVKILLPYYHGIAVLFLIFFLPEHSKFDRNVRSVMPLFVPNVTWVAALGLTLVGRNWGAVM